MRAACGIRHDKLMSRTGEVKRHAERYGAHRCESGGCAQAAIFTDPIDIEQVRKLLRHQQEVARWINLHLPVIGMRNAQWPGGTGNVMQFSFVIDMEACHVS